MSALGYVTYSKCILRFSQVPVASSYLSFLFVLKSFKSLTYDGNLIPKGFDKSIAQHVTR